MQRILFHILALAALASLTACGGSGGSGAGQFGLSSCSLGCSGNTFAINSTQANKDITFTFNDDVDPASVNLTSFSIVNTANGSAASGVFLVSGRRVVFRPSLLETTAGLRFGLDDGATYDVRILDASSPNAVRSVRNQRNQTYLTGDLTIDGVADLVPGPPTVESITPSQAVPPTDRNFSIRIVFGDLMRTLPLANPETGQSTLITVKILDTGVGTSSVVSGLFSSVVDRDALTTTVTFVPTVPFPGSGGGQRVLQVSLSQQISDLVGNLLQGAGTYSIPLPNLPTVNGLIEESFVDHSREDVDGSTLGLWAGVAGALDSRLDPTTGRHFGGGSGVLGSLDLQTGALQLDTDSAVVMSELLGEAVTVNGGLFPFTEIRVGASGLLLGTGSNPLRLYSGGAVVVDGTISADGVNAPANFGKYYFISSSSGGGEQIINEPITNMQPDLRNGGGDGGEGKLAGGGGGKGGQAWYFENEGTSTSGNYYNFATFPGSGFYNWQTQGTSLAPTRWNNNLSGAQFCGANGDGVGGVAAQGDPFANFASIPGDRANGSGMGSWAWPPRSNRIVDQLFQNPIVFDSHVILDGNGAPVSRDPHAILRSRGGGGGGFWTAGARGGYFDQSATDPIGRALYPDFEPYVDVASSIWEFNGDGNGNDWLLWDARAGVGVASVPDADGGAYTPLPGQETLDPDAGLLLGGAGGGGAGMSEHGSYAGQPTLGNGNLDTIGTYRSCSGAGGGAGGGALQVHAGSRFTLNGSLSARGGDGGDSEFMLSVPYGESLAVELGTPGDAGGGGGAGGSLLVQARGLLQAGSDSIDVNGGEGGLGSAGNHGGDGGSGVVRIETATGGLSLATLQDLVTPNVAVDLGPVGLPGQPNVGIVSASLPGATGDVMASDGTLFNGNSSGVRSLWLEADSSVVQCKIDDWTVRCEYSDGSTVQTVSYSAASPTTPGVTPVWIAMQSAWMAAGQSQTAQPQILNLGPWSVPGVLAFGDGLDALNATTIRALRFRVVFDQDLVRSLIGTQAGAYFRVLDVSFAYTGD